MHNRGKKWIYYSRDYWRKAVIWEKFISCQKNHPEISIYKDGRAKIKVCFCPSKYVNYD